MDRWEFEETPPGYNTGLMNYRELEDTRPREDAICKDVGASINAEVGFRPDGARVYVKDVDDLENDTVQSHIAADIYNDHIPFLTPEIGYDEVYGKILVEEMPGEFSDDYGEVDQRSLYGAIAQKLLLGDFDLPGNFLTTGNQVVPVDHDMTGRDLVTTKKAVDTWLEDGPDEDLLYREATKLAEQIDIRALEQDLRDERNLMNSWSSREEIRDPEPRDGLFHGSIENIIDNVRAFK
jgi:hypothetical protein